VEKITFNKVGTAVLQGVARVNGGTLYIGSGGIVTSGANPDFSTTLKLAGGTLGAAEDWSSAADIEVQLSGLSTIRAADALDTAHDIELAGTVTGSGGFLKSGGGNLTLAGANTYSGDTTVSAGTLSLGQVNASNDSSTVSIASGAFLNLGFGGIDTVDKLFINGIQQNIGDYTSAHASGRFTGGGTLRVASGPVATGFASWIDDFDLALADQDPPDDPDNDGMDNLLEFVLNGNPAVSDNSILPDLVVTATAFEFTYQRRDDSLAPETTQTFEWGTTLAAWPGSAVVPATSGAVGVATVTVSAGTPDDGVTDTVKISIPKTEDGGAGKLFGRLRIVKP
jgi:autotransporter-associated beta strand protein